MFLAPFIKLDRPFDAGEHAPCPAPLFRRRFTVNASGKAVLRVCAVGYGYVYLNGRPITADRFESPVSAYDKLVWYREYDVTELVQTGDNVIAVALGNGFFNEQFPSAWDNNIAPWRDHPQFALDLTVNGETVLETDERFVSTDRSFVTYNQLRSGETFDARRYDPAWKTADFDDTDWTPSVISDRMTAVERRLCPCEPIRECETHDFVSVRETAAGYLLDFGVNLAGYVRMTVDAPRDTVIELRHAEQINPDGSLKLNNLNVLYPSVDFQTDRFICGDRPVTWSPHFTYHGFRYVQVTGLTRPPKKGEFVAVFVHQDTEKTGDFTCSDVVINWYYDAAMRSTYSNLYGVLTDCPTREKFGWTNDAQTTLEQLYLNFAIRPFIEKWATDIRLSMTDDGQIPSIVPSHGWGLGWGPVCDGLLFQLPYIDWLYTGDTAETARFLPYMRRYYAWYRENTDQTGWICDWDGHGNRELADKTFIYLFFKIRFCQRLLWAERILGESPTAQYAQDLAAATEEMRARYIDQTGRSTETGQAAVSMLLSLGVFDAAPLTEQLLDAVRATGGRLNVGMMGLPHLFEALFEQGHGDVAYRLLTAADAPSFAQWRDEGATTLYETWYDGHTDSKNHHMLSSPVAWLFKGFLGLRPSPDHPGFAHVTLKPCFAKGLTHCRGTVRTVRGDIAAAWCRTEDGIRYTVTLPAGVSADFGGQTLTAGTHTFFITEEAISYENG